MSDKNTPPEAEELTEDTVKAQDTIEAGDKKAPDTSKKSREKKDSHAEELKKLTAELAAEKDKHLRTLAEYDNFRKRSQKERESIYTDVRASTLEALLPVFDNLERAVAQPSEDIAYKRGVEMIMGQLMEIFTKLGVSEIDAKKGDSFDPEIHNAVMHVDDDSLAEGVIAEEFQKGFRLGDKVIRHSVVKVAN